MAHARRKFFELHAATKSQLAEQALNYIGQLYEIERQVKDLCNEDRRQVRQTQASPLAQALHPGCSPNEPGYPMARPLRKRWTTALNAGAPDALSGRWAIAN